MKTDPPFAAASRARRRALQGIYQWHVNRQEPDKIVAQFLDQQDFSNVDTELFRQLVSGVIRDEKDLGKQLEPSLDRSLDQVDLMEKVVLLMGMYELVHCPSTPWKVVLDECVELAKRFGSEQGHTYVNGVLDKAAAGIRKK
jgi:N utilization substance protein B